MESFPPRTFVAVLLLCALSAPTLSGPALAADNGLNELDAKLEAATGKLIAVMKAKNPGKKGFTIAAVPLTDTGRKRRCILGVRAAEVVTRHLTKQKLNQKLDWLKVGNRIDLPSIEEEHRLWSMDAKRKQPETLAPGADLLIVGSTTFTGKEVELELRLVLAKTGNLIEAEKITIKMTPSLRALRRFVDARGAANIDDDDIARVTNIELDVTAQRPKKLGGLLRQWKVKNREVLKNGDQFNIRFVADADAYIYVFCHGSDGDVSRLFPTDEWEAGRREDLLSPYCRGEGKYYTPGEDKDEVQRFYKLDNIPGRNIIYVAARREPEKNLPDLKRQLKKTEGVAAGEALLRTFHFDHIETFEFSQK